MPLLNFTITALGPLVFNERKPDGQFRSSMPYISGGIIRGALAQQLIDADQVDSDEFRMLFTEEDAPLFRSAYPSSFDGDGPNGTFRRSCLLPATAYSCKTEGGFEKHGIYDSLIDRLCCETLDVRIPYLPRCNHSDHKSKPERVETFGGFYFTGKNGKRGVSVPSKLLTRVALNRQRRVAEDRMLYSPLVLSESSASGASTTFHGAILVNERNHSVVKEYLPQLTHIGGGVTRGFGQVEVALIPEILDDLPARLERFNAMARRRWTLWEQLPHGQKNPAQSPQNGTFFSIMLLSDGILRQEDWGQTVRLTPEMLGPVGSKATLLRCYTNAAHRGGWNTAWGLPKDTEIVSKMSGVYVYYIPTEFIDEKWMRALDDLELGGVGQRRGEGFGQVRVCDDFHCDIQEVH